MTAPTPDEAAARGEAPYGDEVLWHIRSLREHGYAQAAQHVQAMASHRAAHGQTTESALRAELEQARAANEALREENRQLYVAAEAIGAGARSGAIPRFWESSARG